MVIQLNWSHYKMDKCTSGKKEAGTSDKREEAGTLGKKEEAGATEEKSYISKFLQKLRDSEEAAARSKQEEPPKNFMKENWKRLKKLDKKVKEKKILDAMEKPKKPNRYSYVESKVYNAYYSDDEYTDPLANITKEFVAALEDGYCPTREKIPHVPLHKRPAPLSELKRQLLEKEKEVEMEKEQLKKLKLVPPGHIVLSEKERKNTLEVLLQNKALLVSSLASIPVRNDTPTLQTYTKRLEKQLDMVEAEIDNLTKKKAIS